jgi:hypothetical protein
MRYGTPAEAVNFSIRSISHLFPFQYPLPHEDLVMRRLFSLLCWTILLILLVLIFKNEVQILKDRNYNYSLITGKEIKQ